MSVEAMYQDIILDHYREKHHAGLREPFWQQIWIPSLPRSC